MQPCSVQERPWGPTWSTALGYEPGRKSFLDSIMERLWRGGEMPRRLNLSIKLYLPTPQMRRLSTHPGVTKDDITALRDMVFTDL